MRYLCNECGTEFKSPQEENRECPTCKSSSDQHIKLGLTQADDYETWRSEEQ